RWLRAAEELAGVMVERFADPQGGGYFSTPAGQGDLIVRLKDLHDGSTPSGNAMAATGLLRLAVLTGTARWREEAESGLLAWRGGRRGRGRPRRRRRGGGGRGCSRCLWGRRVSLEWSPRPGLRARGRGCGFRILKRKRPSPPAPLPQSPIVFGSIVAVSSSL